MAVLSPIALTLGRSRGQTGAPVFAASLPRNTFTITNAVLCLASLSLLPAARASQPFIPNTQAQAYVRDVVNPKNDNIFLHVSPEAGHRLIISLIYFSFWLGALGWDIFSTIQFDWRLVRETNWKSPFSICNTVAYWFSRYFTFGWLVRCVLDGITASDNCRGRLVLSASLYGVAVCSSESSGHGRIRRRGTSKLTSSFAPSPCPPAYLVFGLRTVNLWNMRMAVVVPLTAIFIAMVGFCAALPQNMHVENLSGDPFCSYQLGGWFSYAVLSLCALFDATNFLMLGIKLSKSGLKGILRCLLPQSKPNYDHEDVMQMLLQRTGIFTVVQFLLLVTIASLYASVQALNFQLMQVAAFHAISASMAGRIFRRAWRLSREQSPSNINKPPDYSSNWQDAGATVIGGNGTTDMGGVDGVPVSKKAQSLLEEAPSYVEGELKSSSKDKGGPILPQTTRGDTVLNNSPASHQRRLSAGGDAHSIGGPDDIQLANTGAAPADMDGSASSATNAMNHWAGNDGDISCQATIAPPYSGGDENTPPLQSTHIAMSQLPSSNPKKGLGLSFVHRGRRASTSAGPSRAEKPVIQRRPQTMATQHIATPVQIISPASGAAPPSLLRQPVGNAIGLAEVSDQRPDSPTWPPVALETTYNTPSVPSTPQASSTASTARSRMIKTSIQNLSGRPHSSGSNGSGEFAGTRPSFVASPAMAAGTAALPGASGNGVVDINAAKAAATLPSASKQPNAVGLEHDPSEDDRPTSQPSRSIRQHGGEPASPRRLSRPSTAPGKSNGASAGSWGNRHMRQQGGAGLEASPHRQLDPQDAFLSVVQSDEQRCAVMASNGHDGDRPRTSRGKAADGVDATQEAAAAAASETFARSRFAVPASSWVPSFAHPLHDADDEDDLPARPSTSHGPAGAPGSFVRLRSLPEEMRTHRGTSRSLARPSDNDRSDPPPFGYSATSNASAPFGRARSLSSHARVLSVVSDKSSRLDASDDGHVIEDDDDSSIDEASGSAIDATYRRLERMAHASDSTLRRSSRGR